MAPAVPTARERDRIVPAESWHVDWRRHDPGDLCTLGARLHPKPVIGGT